MEEEGIGSLYKEYEKLKQKLEKEGLFKEEHKRKIPYMPKVIGVLTSNTGSVIRDIINVSTRRNPNVYIRLLPIPVQGKGAELKIVEAIELMNKEKLANVLILARGGGSIEDLWPFNEEMVARSIYASKIPIISAIGHETDFTISDFVADLRAPTPSAAAELAVPDIKQIELKLNTYEDRLKHILVKKMELARLEYEKCMKSRVFTEPTQKINEYYMILDSNVNNIKKIMENKLNLAKGNSQTLISKLDALSPLKTLIRGYSITEMNSKVVNSVKNLKKDDQILLKFYDGTTNAKII